MRPRINGPIELPSDTTALFTMFFDFPFALTEDLQSCGISHQMRNFTMGGRFKTDVKRLCSFDDTAVVRSA